MGYVEGDEDGENGMRRMRKSCRSVYLCYSWVQIVDISMIAVTVLPKIVRSMIIRLWGGNAPYQGDGNNMSDDSRDGDCDGVDLFHCFNFYQ
jgi:hypothetical protein